MIKKYMEVFKAFGKVSVRGIVEDVTDESFTVKFTYKDGETLTQEFSLSDVGTEVFETERELIRSKGSTLIELAPPREVELKYGKDFYGQPICEGDKVIAMADQPLYNKIEGIVSKVYLLSSVGFEKMTFIDIADEKGQPVYKRALCNMFTIPSRFCETNA